MNQVPSFIIEGVTLTQSVSSDILCVSSSVTIFSKSALSFCYYLYFCITFLWCIMICKEKSILWRKLLNMIEYNFYGSLRF